ncbi:SET domain-containing protein [Rickenella mellea]|uniref:SET domain-containing protein n=1 Tax=Rickenella mellea TaxID=50990 RepID=A0A4Y7PKW1_9AGAM|nr:SET domain-containing protein [Rickenella mellea]
MSLTYTSGEISTRERNEMMTSIAEVVKNKGNEAFKDGDYKIARSLFSHAMAFEPENGVYVLNRSAVNLKLNEWKDAENDAAAALQLCRDPGLKRKALYRRSQAKREQGLTGEAREDLNAFLLEGGKREDIEEEYQKLDRGLEQSPVENLPITATEQPTNTRTLQDTAYEMKDSGLKGLGAFATRKLHRGEVITADIPLFHIPEALHYAVSNKLAMQAVRRLEPYEIVSFLSLKNSHTQHQHVNPLSAIYHTNAFDGCGVCIRASRFNHSCVPNARFAFLKSRGIGRMFALRDITIGEEICVSYLSGRNVYGSTSEERQLRLLSFYGFRCTCTACSPEDGLERIRASDARRRQIKVIWERLPNYNPRTQAESHLNDCVTAIKLLREEGYYADADDFAIEASALCAMHSDWESSTYWAGVMFEAGLRELGFDHERTQNAWSILQNPQDSRRQAGAGMFRGQRFTNIRL